MEEWGRNEPKGRIEDELRENEERFHERRKVDKESWGRGSRRGDMGAGQGSRGEGRGAQRRKGKLKARQ